MLQTMEVIIRDLPKDYSNMWSALLGAVLGAVVSTIGTMYVQRKQLQKEAKYKFMQEQLEALTSLYIEYANIVFYYEERSIYKIYEENFDRYYKQLMDAYYYLPEEFQQELLNFLEFKTMHWHDGISDLSSLDYYEYYQKKILNYSKGLISHIRELEGNLSIKVDLKEIRQVKT